MRSRVVGVALVALSLAGPASGLGLTIIQEDLSSFARDDLLDAKCAQADQDARDGLRVTIAGACISSCAFCRPRNPYFCSAPNTELWFHSSPNGVEYNPMLMSALPPVLQAWVAARGGLKPTFWGLSDWNWLVLKGDELHQLVPLCREWAANARTGPQTPIPVRPVLESRDRPDAVREALKAHQRVQAIQPPMAPVAPPSGAWPRR